MPEGACQGRAPCGRLQSMCAIARCAPSFHFEGRLGRADKSTPFALLQEKLRPIDKKLAYQIEKLLAAGQRPADEAAAAQAAAGPADALSYGPRPDQLVPRAGGANAGDASADGGLGPAAARLYGCGHFPPSFTNPRST